MKKMFSLFVVLHLCLGSVAFAAVTGAEAPKGEEPLLITNAGQGPGGKMGRLLVTRAAVVKELTYNAEPKPDDLAAGGAVHRGIHVRDGPLGCDTGLRFSAHGEGDMAHGIDCNARMPRHPPHNSTA